MQERKDIQKLIESIVTKINKNGNYLDKRSLPQLLSIGEYLFSLIYHLGPSIYKSYGLRYKSNCNLENQDLVSCLVATSIYLDALIAKNIPINATNVHSIIL